MIASDWHNWNIIKNIFINVMFLSLFVASTTNATIYVNDNYNSAEPDWECADGVFGSYMASIDPDCKDRTLATYGTKTNLMLDTGKTGYALTQWRTSQPFIKTIAAYGDGYTTIETYGNHFFTEGNDVYVRGTTNYNALYNSTTPDHWTVLSVIDSTHIKVSAPYVSDESFETGIASTNFFNIGYSGYPNYPLAKELAIKNIFVRAYVKIDPDLHWAVPGATTLKMDRFYYNRLSSDWADSTYRGDILPEWNGTTDANAKFKVIDPLGGLTVYSFSWADINDGQWHCIEVNLRLPTWTDGTKNSDGGVHVWLNGVEQELCIPYGECSVGFDNITFGSKIYEDTAFSYSWTPFLGNASDGYWTESTGKWTYYSVDELVIADSYIGPDYGIITGVSKMSGSGQHSLTNSGTFKFQ